MLNRPIFLTICLFFSFAAWAGDPGYHAIRNTSRTIVYKSGKAKEVVDLRYRVTTEAGAVELSNYQLRVPGGDAKFKILKAETKTAGVVHEIMPEDVKISSHPEGGEGLFELKDVVIPFNQVKVGSEIQVKYIVEREALIDGIFGIQGGIANNILADEESQIFLSDLPLKIFTKDFDEYYSLTEKKNGDRFEVEIAPTKKTRMLAGRQLKVGLYALSTANSWVQLNQVMSKKYELAITKKLPPAFQAIVDSAKPIKDRKEQIEHVADRLKKIVTYSGNWLTVAGRFYPSGHESVVQKAKGDCKDFAASMVAILRALGLEANVALTFRNESTVGEKLIQGMAKLPNLAIFNHAIVWAKDEKKKVWWVDPTNPIVMADVLAHDILGNFALVLDKKSDEVQFLPTKNAQASETSIHSVIKINSDNGAEVTSQLELNPSAYNEIAMLESRKGPDYLKKVLSVKFNPRAKMSVNYEKETEGAKTKFKVNMTSMDLVTEKKGKISYVEVYHPVTFLLLQSSRGSQVEFREEGTIESTTKIVGRHAHDPVDQECYGRSPWVDIDRTVSNVEKDIVIVDRVTIKNRTIAKSESTSQEELLNLADSLKDCAQNYRIITFLDPSQKTTEEVALDKLKGPPVEEMSEKDAERLENETNLSLRGYVQKKLLKYYTHEIKAAPQDPDPYWQRALIKRELGYLQGDEYLTSYLDDALADVATGFQISEDKSDPKLLGAKIKILTDAKKYGEAGQVFKDLLEVAPKLFETYYLGYRLNRVQNSLENAEKWLSLAEKVAMSDVEKHKFHGQMARLKVDQKKLTEAIAHYETLLKGKLANGWDWHNAALIYCSMQELDKCIEYEKKALALFDFAMARNGLSNALMDKAKNLENAARAPANTEPVEELVLESIKYNPKNTEALLKISTIHLEKFKKTGKEEHLQKGRPYLDKVLAIIPDDAKANELLQSYTPKEDQK